ncbi:MAG: cytochrome c-type biogenesis CcmF C-terminal domain-containing protein [Polyangiales bacterium]
MNPTSFDAGIPAFGTGVLYAFLVTAAAAFALAVTAGTSSPARAPRLLRAARLASLGTCALIGLDVMVLLYAFLSHDFRIRYVAHYSDRSMPTAYLIAALWGGQDGSLLWWSFLLSLYTAACALWIRGRYKELAPWVLATLMSVVMFFGVLMAFAANPFAATFGGAPPDGEGLNPSLQNFYMAIHPPSLYVGFVGCAVPFAFAVSALITGRLNEEWVVAVRRWVLFAWMFLSIGNVLGMLWAYEELGWGGFWAWDPVENAACLPWWTCTAFLHSVMIQERRGFLKVWNVSLLLGSFFLTIFGTFLTRSGLISSVHSFAQSGIGIYFVWYMGFLALFCIALVVWRLPKLRGAAQIDSALSREAMFVVNNWMLLGICVFILLATTWPKVSEWLWNERLTVGASFYNAWLAPIGLVLFAIIGVGTLTPWRKATPKNLLEAFRGPLAAGLVVGVLHAAVGRHLGFAPVVHLDPIYDNVTAIKLGGLTLGHVNVGRALAWLDGHLPPFATGLFAFNVAALWQEFQRGTLARMRSKKEDAPTAFLSLVGKNRRRYGGYVVHFGFALMMMGYMGAGYRQETEASLAPGQTLRVGRYTLRYEGAESRRTPDKREIYARVTAFVGGERYTELRPARFIFTARPEMPTTEVAIHSRPREDLYVVMNSLNPDTHVAHIKGVVNPLTLWIWVGGLVLVFGVMVAMWPDASREAARAVAPRAVPAGATGLLLLLTAGGALVLLAPRDALAQGSEHRVSSGMPVGVAENFTPAERHVFDQLLCMCGGCARLPLATCACDWAANHRDAIRGRLAAGDSEAAVVGDYVARYGREALTVPPDQGHNKALYIVPVAALAAGAGLVFHLARKWARREAPPTLQAGAKPEAPKPDAAPYDARIDEELRGLDE